MIFGDRRPVQAALAWGVSALRIAGVEGAARDARAIMAATIGVPPDRLTMEARRRISDAEERLFHERIGQRARGRPVSRIVGGRWFWDGWYVVTDDVLDPRPETETLVAAVLEGPMTRVLDLGTGSGAILLSLLGAREGATGLGTDVSEAALDVARGNAAAHGLSDRAGFVRADWFDGVEGRFDLIVSNPPYIAADEMAGLSREVREHDPEGALTDGGDGLSAYRAIAAGAAAHLAPGGRLLVEIGWRQGAAVSGIFRDAGLDGIAVSPDLDGRDRVVTARPA